MATILAEYVSIRESLEKENRTHFSIDRIKQYCEIIYRIQVLKTMQFLVMSTPKEKKVQEIISHYQATDYYISQVTVERQYSTTDEKKACRCQTAFESMIAVQKDYQKRFSSCRVDNLSVEQYRERITNAVQSFLCVWVGYRDTMIFINVKESAKNEQLDK